MKNRKRQSRLPVDVFDALRAIAATGKGRCWYCDLRLPEAGAAIAGGWDVQRVDELPVASIILVCPGCVRCEAAPGRAALASGSEQAPAVRVHAAAPSRNRGPRVLELNPKRVWADD